MTKCEMQCSIATHGNARDGAVAAAGGDAVVLFDVGEKFLQQEIFVALLAVFRIDIKSGAGVGCGDQKILDLAFFAHVFEEIPRAGVHERLFVIAESMEEIQDWKAAGLIGIERGRKNDAIRDAMGQGFAGNGVALDSAAGSEAARHGGEQSEREQKKKCADGPIHIAERRRG